MILVRNAWRFARVFALLLLCATAQNARAAFTFTIEESSGNVQITGSGTFDLGSVTPVMGGSIGSARIAPSFPLLVGAGSPSNTIAFNVSGPSSWGSGGQSSDSTDSGDFVATDGGTIYLPATYVSGAPLSDTSTYLGQSFASLGLNPGIYTYTWGSGQHADSLTVAVVPEPSSLLLFVVGGMIILIIPRRFRRSRALSLQR